MKNIILSIFGFLFLALGIVGIMLPILPTTPFIVLSSICFAGNKKMTNLLMKSSFFSGFINNYKNKTGVKLSLKIKAIIFITITIGVSVWFAKTLWLKILLSTIYLAVLIHILCIKTNKDD